MTNKWDVKSGIKIETRTEGYVITRGDQSIKLTYYNITQLLEFLRKDGYQVIEEVKR